MAVAKQRAKLESTLLSAKNAAPAADLSVIRIGNRKAGATAPVVALTDTRAQGDAAAAPGPDAMFFKKGSASASTFRPTYWSYERRAAAPPAPPVPESSALPGLEQQLGGHKEQPADRAVVTESTPVASLFGGISGDDLLAETTGAGSFPEAAVRREIAQRFRQPEVEALLRALAAERGETGERDETEADDNAEVLRVAVDEPDEAETAPEAVPAPAVREEVPAAVAAPAVEIEAEPEAAPVADAEPAPATVVTPAEAVASEPPVAAAPEAGAAPAEPQYPVARTRRIGVDKISGRRRDATAQPDAGTPAPAAAPGAPRGEELTSAIENVLASRWYGSEQRQLGATEQQRGRPTGRPAARPDPLQTVTPSSLIAELAAARRTIAPAPQPKLKAKGGLIAVVVLIVLGLAGAGGWMFVNDIGPAALLAPKAAVSSTAAPAQSKPPVASPAQR